MDLILIIAICAIAVGTILLLVSSVKRSDKNAPHALGLPLGSVRAVFALILIVFFVLVAVFFYVNLGDDTTAKAELAERILTVLGTLVIAVSSFYFGVKATEQGNRIARETFIQISENYSGDVKNIPPNIILEAIKNNEKEWKLKYDCISIKLGKKKTESTQFELNCIVFVVALKLLNVQSEQEIPALIEYNSKGKVYQIPTDVEEYSGISTGEKNFQLLSEEKQYAIVEDYIESTVDILLNKHPSVTGAYAGKKKINNNELNLISLVLQVEDKTDSAIDLLPRFIDYKKYKIPTDVEEASKTKLNFSLNPLNEGISRLNENAFGSIGFPVYYNNEIHLVSCYHVLFSKELNSGILNTNNIVSDTKIVSPPFGKSGSKIVGDIVKGTVSKFLDFAILKPNVSLLNKIENDGFSNEYSVLRRNFENQIFLKFYGSKSNYVKTPILRNIASVQPFDYGNGNIVYLRGLIQMDLSSLSGDSGAAVYDIYDNIVGIIVGSDSKYTYAISAYNIFDKTHNTLSLKPI